MNARRSSLPAIAGWEYASRRGEIGKGSYPGRPHTRRAVSGAREFSLNRLARIWHRRRQAAIDRDRLSVDVGGVVAGEKQSHRRQFMRLAGALARVGVPGFAAG